VTVPTTSCTSTSNSERPRPRLPGCWRRLRERWKQRAHALRLEVYALWLAYRDPRVPWYAKAFAALVAAYALSPIDLIPDFIPFLGQLDDLLLVPLGVWLAVRIIPRPVLQDCRARAREAFDQGTIRPWVSVVLVAAVWLVLLALLFLLVLLPILRRRALRPAFSPPSSHEPQDQVCCPRVMS
jgi:uncharacterized membrane protein YkvA (DUF1232 family)